MKEEAIEVFVRDIAMGKFFESVSINLEAELPSALGSSASKFTNYITSDLAGLIKEKMFL